MNRDSIKNYSPTESRNFVDSIIENGKMVGAVFDNVNDNDAIILHYNNDGLLNEGEAEKEKNLITENSVNKNNIYNSIS